MYKQNNLPGTQSNLTPKPGTAQEWVISSEVPIIRKVTRVGNTNAPDALNKRSLS